MQKTVVCYNIFENSCCYCGTEVFIVACYVMGIVFLLYELFRQMLVQIM